MSTNLSESSLVEARVNPSGFRSRPDRIFLLFCVFILLLAGSLRIYHLSKRSLWLDEAIAANISRGTLTDTLNLTRALHSAPMTHPVLLHAIEMVSVKPFSVRLLSFVASLLAVGLMLCFVKIPSIDQGTAALSALMLGLSASQIRYAQEVREYSLGVLFAALLIYLFLATASANGKPREPVALYLALFSAPLIQYGLILFSAGVLAGLFILALTSNARLARIRQAATGGAFLGLGCLLSYFMTLRFQWGDNTWYLQGSYPAPGFGLLHFILGNSYSLFIFLLPGRATAVIAIFAMLVYLFLNLLRKALSPISLLFLCSFATVLACSLLHLYPYGPIRQCLFLAPVLCLFASESVFRLTRRFTPVVSGTLLALVVGIVIVSGTRQVHSYLPYAEVEDVQAILVPLRAQLQPQDQVYVYSGAVPAIDFYFQGHDPRFIYGDFHRESPGKYLSELTAGLHPGTTRVWLVLSHVYQDEDTRILQDLRRDWDVRQIIAAKASALYLAAPKNGTRPVTSSTLTHADDSFLNWSLRNSTRPVR